MHGTSLVKGGLQDVFQALSVYHDKTMSTVSITDFGSDSNDIATASSVSLKYLESLDLSGNGLVFLPYDIFSSLVTLQVINLAFNNLITIPDLTPLDKLNFIDLSHNSFTTLDNKYRLMLDKTAENNNEFHLSLWENTFSCICESTEFLIWLQETRV
ncbi:hypothetical protein SNE40_001102 [Patella caerulea]|uniref:Uncharacterized protein n=1 Tax=Patella caerulea TaxID=87958 RepID=A0AAN8KF86_PATCE